MAIIQEANAVFYHPLNDVVEALESVAWTGTGIFDPGKVSDALNMTTGDSIDLFGAENEFHSAAADFSSVAALSPTMFIVAYATSVGKAKVGTVSGTTITFGAESEFLPGAGASGLSVAVLSATAFVVAYFDSSDFQHGKTKIGTVSGTNITFGAESEFLDTGGANSISVAALTATAFVVAYRDDTESALGAAKIGTVSGTSISFGPKFKFLPFGAILNVSVAALSATAFVVACRDNNESGHGKAHIGIVSGTNITFGAQSEFLTATTAVNISVAVLSPTVFVVAYQDDADLGHGTAKVGTVTGTSIAFGSETEFNVGDTGNATGRSISATTLSSTKFVVAYRDNPGSAHGTAKVGTISGTNITFGAELEFSSAGTTDFISAAALSATTFVVAYRDDADTFHGTAKIGTVTSPAALTRVRPAPAFGTGSDFLGSATSNNRVLIANLDATKFVVAYQDGGDSGHGKAKIGTVSGTDVTFGAEAVFLEDSFGGGEVAALSATSFVVAYSTGINVAVAKIGTISGTDVTFGAASAQYSASTSAIAVLSPTVFVVTHADNADGGKGKGKVGTVSGTNITFGADSEFLSTGLAKFISASALSATKFVVAYDDVPDSNHGTARVGVVSGTNIAFGLEAEFQSMTASPVSVNQTSVVALSATKFVVAYSDNSDSDHGKARVGIVSGTDITFGAETEFQNTGVAFSLIAAALDSAILPPASANTFVVAYRNQSDSNRGIARIGAVSGTSILFGPESDFLAANAIIIGGAALSSTVFVVGFRDGASVGPGTARVGTVQPDPYATAAGATRLAFSSWSRSPSA